MEKEGKDVASISFNLGAHTPGHSYEAVHPRGLQFLNLTPEAQGVLLPSKCEKKKKKR